MVAGGKRKGREVGEGLGLFFMLVGMKGWFI